MCSRFLEGRYEVEQTEIFLKTILLISKAKRERDDKNDIMRCLQNCMKTLNDTINDMSN